MTWPRVAVLLLCLLSLGCILGTVSLAAAPFLLPWATSLSRNELDLSAGCFSVMLFVLFLPFSLVPAFLAFFIRERYVLPRSLAERQWWESEPFREGRLHAWMSWVVDLLLVHRALPSAAGDPVPLLLQGEIPRGLGELDPGRRERLLLFIRAAGLEIEAGWMSRGSALTGPPLFPTIRRGLVMAAVTGFSLIGVFLLFLGTAGFVIFMQIRPLRDVGIDFGPGDFIAGLSPVAILALLSGLAAAGFLRMQREADNALVKRVRERRALWDQALATAVVLLERLAALKGLAGASELLIRSIVRAIVLATVPGLGGEGRGNLIAILFRDGWITGERSLDFADAPFQGARLAEARLPEVQLRGADLSGADLRGADLRRADLAGADLRGAQLQRAILQDASLKRARIEGANLWGADLAGADLSGTVGNAESLATPQRSGEIRYVET